MNSDSAGMKLSGFFFNHRLRVNYVLCAKKWPLQYLQDAIIIIDDFGVKTADLKGYIQSYLKESSK